MDTISNPITGRLLSLDFLRGFIMVLLAIESTGLYEYLNDHTAGQPFNHFIIQFTHYPWHGLHFWDLVQPAFMFMAGVAMAYSFCVFGLEWLLCYFLYRKKIFFKL